MPPSTSLVTCHYAHPNFTYSSASCFFNVQEHIAKKWFEKSHVKTTCILSNKQSRDLTADNDITNVQDSMSAENDVSPEHLNVDDLTQKEHSIASIYD